VVETRAGGGGTIGMQAVAQSAAVVYALVSGFDGTVVIEPLEPVGNKTEQFGAQIRADFARRDRWSRPPASRSRKASHPSPASVGERRGRGHSPAELHDS
jgi:hypothetical protein